MIPHLPPPSLLCTWMCLCGQLTHLARDLEPSVSSLFFQSPTFCSLKCTGCHRSSDVRAWERALLAWMRALQSCFLSNEWGCCESYYKEQGALSQTCCHPTAPKLHNPQGHAAVLPGPLAVLCIASLSTVVHLTTSHGAGEPSIREPEMGRACSLILGEDNIKEKRCRHPLSPSLPSHISFDIASESHVALKKSLKKCLF